MKKKRKQKEAAKAKEKEAQTQRAVLEQLFTGRLATW
jgi:hypothetical protein